MTEQLGSQDAPDPHACEGDRGAVDSSANTAEASADGAAGEPHVGDVAVEDTRTSETASVDPAGPEGGPGVDDEVSAAEPESGHAAPGPAAASSTGNARGSGSARQRDATVTTPEPPDLDADEKLDAALEALLLVVDVPAGEQLLAETLGQPVRRVREALYRLAEHYTAAGRGIDLRRVGDGWRMYTRELYAPYVERYLLDGQRSKLTRAAMETLAVIAYRQPVTRSRVAAVRGVNVDGVIRTLVGRGLVEEAGNDSETGGVLYCTTELFLERLGLSSLKDLPPLAPLLPEVDAIDDV